MLIHNDQKLYEHVQKLSKYRKPNNYSAWFHYMGKTYIYMSEVDPHNHRGEFPEHGKYWTCTFSTIDMDFRFVYYNKQNERCVEEIELGKPYVFNALRQHAVIHKNRVEHFDNRRYWKDTWEPEEELRMIFELKGEG